MTHFPIHARIHAEYRHASGVMRITHTPDKGKTKYDPTKPSLIFNLNKVQICHKFKLFWFCFYEIRSSLIIY